MRIKYIHLSCLSLCDVIMQSLIFKAAWRHKIHVRNPQRHPNLTKRNRVFLFVHGGRRSVFLQGRGLLCDQSAVFLRKRSLCGGAQALFVVTLKAPPLAQWGFTKPEERPQEPPRQRKMTHSPFSLPFSGRLIQTCSLWILTRLSGCVFLFSLFYYKSCRFHVNIYFQVFKML